MKECKKCGQYVQDVETYCPRCGSRELEVKQGNPVIQRPPQRVQQVPNHNQGNGAPPNTFRQPQPAPPGYRNPNFVPGATQPQGSRAVNQPNPNMAPRPAGNPMNNGGQMHQNNPNNPNNPNMGQRPPMPGNMQAPAQNGRRGPAPNQPVNMQAQMQSSVQEPGKKHKFGFGKGKKAPGANQGNQVPPHQQQINMQNSMNTMTTEAMQDNSVVSIMEWLIILVKLIIPIYNIIFLIGAWTNKPMNETVRNYLKLYTFVLGGSILLMVISSVFLGSILSSLMW